MLQRRTATIGIFYMAKTSAPGPLSPMWGVTSGHPTLATVGGMPNLASAPDGGQIDAPEASASKGGPVLLPSDPPVPAGERGAVRWADCLAQLMLVLLESHSAAAACFLPNLAGSYAKIQLSLGATSACFNSCVSLSNTLLSCYEPRPTEGGPEQAIDDHAALRVQGGQSMGCLS